jgi:hypothetical protein
MLFLWVRLFIAAACGLLMLSLPFGRTEPGATLRRWASGCFLLAFLPSIVSALFFPTHTNPPSVTAVSTAPASGAATNVLADLGCITLLAVLALVAYGILKLRGRFTRKATPADPWERFFPRGGGKRPFSGRPSDTRSRPPFFFRDEEDD